MKALVTGAAGFLGSHVAEWLIRDGNDVVALDDLSGGYIENVPSEAKWVCGSITDYALLEDLFEREKFDYVFHLAAYAAEGLSHFIRRYNYETNLVGSINLINLSVNHKIKCYIFTSSIAVYGANQLPMTEDLIPRPEDPYGIAKYAVELDLEAACHQFGLNYIIFRPHNVYGERQNIGDKYRNVIGIFMNQILAGKPLTTFGDGTQTRAFSYIDDVATVIARSYKNSRAFGEIFNIGADQVYSINQLAAVVADAMGVPLEVIHLKQRNEVKHAFASHKKVKVFFETSDPVTLQYGVQRMAAWVKKTGVRKTQNFSNIEIYEQMPEGW